MVSSKLPTSKTTGKFFSFISIFLCYQSLKAIIFDLYGNENKAKEVGVITNISLWIIFAVLVTISVQLSNVTKLLRSIDAKNAETRPD